jgi:hypothetical protein
MQASWAFAQRVTRSRVVGRVTGLWSELPCGGIAIGHGSPYEARILGPDECALANDAILGDTILGTRLQLCASSYRRHCRVHQGDECARAMRSPAGAVPLPVMQTYPRYASGLGGA